MEKYQVINIELADFAQSVIGETDGKVVCHMYLDTYKITEKEKVNAEIMCDALNTYNQTPVLPSELLRQRDELLSALKNMKFYTGEAKNSFGTILNDTLPYTTAKELIKQIENE